MDCDVPEMAEREPTWWDGVVDLYLAQIDRAVASVSRLQRKSGELSLSHELVEPNSKLLLKVTIGALVLVFAIVLCSCAATNPGPVEPQPHPVRQREPMRLPSKGGEQLYVKRESVLIKKRETGSHTGSLWADTKPPRSLYSEERPSRTGEVVVVTIPESLRYSAPAAAAGSAAKGATDGKDAGGKGTTMTDPNSVGILGASTAEPLTEIPMEIVAVEPTGDVFLRGTREYQTNQGTDRKVSVMAKIPRRALTGYTVDAKQLTAITVHEDFEGNVSDYAANGWDKVVSRKISGFVPDLNAELATLEDVRAELAANQKALREQQNGVREERERLLKERARLQAALEKAEAAAAQAEAEARDAAAKGEQSGEDADPAKEGKAKAPAKKSSGKEPSSDAKTAPKSRVGGTRP
jgi:flagellar basal body L-ring protein FlgH